MTPDELRTLAREATPGPWEVHRKRQNIILTGEVWTSFTAPEADARLIALAPQLALLCAEMGEALRGCLQEGIDEDDVHWIAVDPRGVRPAQTALASLEALERE